jgi:ATP synthase F1 complex assembly factor 1
MLFRATRWIHNQTPLKKWVLPGKKKLEEIIHFDLFATESPERIVQVWGEYYNRRMDVLSDSMKSNIFQLMKSRMKQCPNFILPIQKKLGYFNMYLQSQEKQILFTTLREFQMLGEKSIPAFTMNYYDDFEKQKELVLWRGEINVNVMDKGDAYKMVKMMYSFYIQDDLYNRFVEPFNKRPHEFDYQKFLEEIEHSKPKKVIKLRKKNMEEEDERHGPWKLRSKLVKRDVKKPVKKE